MLKAFAVYDTTEDLIQADIGRFLDAEVNWISAHQPATESGFETDAPERIRAWMKAEGAIVGQLEDSARRRLADWLDLFRGGADKTSLGSFSS